MGEGVPRVQRASAGQLLSLPHLISGVCCTLRRYATLHQNL